MDDIQDTLDYYSDHIYFKQTKAIINLGIYSGLRAKELYQLRLNDFDLSNCTVFVNHNPSIGQSTKNKKSRVSFFNSETRDILKDYFNWFKSSNCSLKPLFSKTHIERIFSDSSVKVKDLRKFFSQEWDRRGGPTSIKKLLMMGHSVRKDVDLMNYNYQSDEDLKRIYDHVMLSNNISPKT
jgi:integrase/recombinase XerD